MIDWMGKKCNRLMDLYNIGAIGFDLEKEGDDAQVILEVNGNQTERFAMLGDVRGLSPDEIERRFVAATFAVGVAEGIPVLVTFADRMMDAADNGELEDVIPF